jgi:hypothetical protein
MQAGAFGGGYFAASFNYHFTASITLTGSTPAGNYGAWSQIAIPSSYVRWIVLQIYDNSATNVTMMQLGLGAAGAEVPFQPVVVVSGGGGGGTAILAFSFLWQATHVMMPPYNLTFPVSLASGTRLSARIQHGVSAGATVKLHASLWG